MYIYIYSFIICYIERERERCFFFDFPLFFFPEPWLFTMQLTYNEIQGYS